MAAMTEIQAAELILLIKIITVEFGVLIGIVFVGAIKI